MKITTKTSCCSDICIWIKQNVNINPLLTENLIIIYQLEDKLFCISKLQIDRELWPVRYLRHEIQEYKRYELK